MADNLPLKLDQGTTLLIHARAREALQDALSAALYAYPEADRGVLWQELLWGAYRVVKNEMGGPMPEREIEPDGVNGDPLTFAPVEPEKTYESVLRRFTKAGL